MNKTEMINNENLDCLVYTDFGWYIDDENRPLYHDVHKIYIEKITDELKKIIQNHTFKNIYATKEVFEQLKIKADEDVCYEMIKVDKLEGLKIDDDYCITKLTKDKLQKYIDYEQVRQVQMYNEYYDVIDESVLQKDVRLITYNNQIVASFRVNSGTVIENVYTVPEYRKRGIMRYFLNETAHVGYTLICLEDRIPFYEKCGFKINEKVVTQCIPYSEELVKIITSH